MNEGDGVCGNEDPICHCITKKALLQLSSTPHPTKQLPAIIGPCKGLHKPH